MKTIILNCMPPANPSMPSPALSSLKGFLIKYGYAVRIVYWNVILKDLEESFVWNKTDANGLLYAAFIALENNNAQLMDEIRIKLLSINPIMMNEGREFLEKHITGHINELRKRIHSTMSREFGDVMFCGFTLKMEQWTFATLLAKILKEINMSIPVIVGGINTEAQAYAYLKSFIEFDVAIWGEGEYALLDLANHYYKNSSISQKNVIMRNTDGSLSHSEGKMRFVDFEREIIIPDYSDYFNQIKGISKISPIIGIEGGRGCHWNLCNFCYLNLGYKYRQKPVNLIMYEIKYSICHYGVFSFQFLDNDVIGNDIEHFIELLDGLYMLKSEYPEFRVTAVEIMSKNISYDLIAKMHMAGIEGIQLGYESSSDNLLKLINKKNTFASNLACLNHCVEFGIRPTSTNVICNLIEEKTSHIIESIHNTRFFRFIYSKCKGFAFSLINLNINSSSRYFKIIQNSKDAYTPTLNYLEKSLLLFVPEQYRWDLYEYSLPYRNPVWEIFKNIQFFFFSNEYSYNFNNENNSTIYQEYFNGNLIEKIHFTFEEASIINYVYNQVRSLNDILEYCNKSGFNILPNEISNLISDSYEKGILYHNSNFTEICSVVKLF